MRSWLVPIDNKNMRVLLIEPRNCWMGLNIALAYLSGALKRAGIEVRVLDLANHRQYNAEEMERYFIDNFKPDLIGISLFYIGYYQVIKSIKRIKRLKKVPIVVGGPQMLIEKEQLLKAVPELDFAIIGDGEKTLVELCEALNGKRTFNSITGLIYRDGNEVKVNKERELNLDIDLYPFPDYEPFGVKKIRSYQIITSRGCPYQCTFCFRSSPRWRARSPENIIEELKLAIDQYAIEEFTIVDDSFNIKPQRVIRFCELLKENQIRLPWRCTGVRADKLPEELVIKMKDAGCYFISIGIESFDEKVFNTINKNESLSQIKESIGVLKKYKFYVSGYFIIGLPGDTYEKTMNTYRKAKELGVDEISFAILLPFPGTKIYKTIYSMPGVKKLENYYNISTVWTFNPLYSRVRTAFELPEYTAQEKIDAYNRIRTKEGDPRPPYHKNLFIFGLNIIFWILKYDFIHFPATLFKVIKNAYRRLVAAKYGRHFYLLDVEYKEEFLKELSRICQKEKNRPIYE